jgi:hypothetical protein
MTAVLITINLYFGVIDERPMRSMERCEVIAQAYNENMNLRGYRRHYCISVGKGWTDK